jgi:hypothetical protein
MPNLAGLAAAVSTTWTTSAGPTGPTTTRMSPAGPTNTRPAYAGPTNTRMSTSGPANTRPAYAGPYDHATASSAAPTVPTRAAAPAEAAAKGVAAPVEAWSAPAVIIPAVVLSTVDELSLFDVVGNCRRHDVVDRQCVDLSGRAQQGERSRGGINPLSHKHLRFVLSRGKVEVTPVAANCQTIG